MNFLRLEELATSALSLIENEISLYGGSPVLDSITEQMDFIKKNAALKINPVH